MPRAGSFVVINGFAFFLFDYNESKGLHAHKIMVLDLNHEMGWPAASLLAPLKHPCVSMSELNGHLVAGHIDGITSIELWFLVDLDISHWSKRYAMEIPCGQNLLS
jgi:hypothetical protein